MLLWDEWMNTSAYVVLVSTAVLESNDADLLKKASLEHFPVVLVEPPALLILIFAV